MEDFEDRLRRGLEVAAGPLTGPPAPDDIARRMRRRRLTVRLQRAGLALAVVAGTSVPFLLLSTEKKERPAARPAGPAGRIVFQSHKMDEGFTQPGEIFVMNADGTGKTNLTKGPADDWSPAWSPDGRAIAFLSDRDGDFELFVMRSDGSDVRQITSGMNLAPDSTPSWGPDGRTIAFSARGPERGHCDFLDCTDLVAADIYLIDAQSGETTAVTFGEHSDWNPVWSPTGGQLGFIRQPERSGAYGFFVVQIQQREAASDPERWQDAKVKTDVPKINRLPSSPKHVSLGAAEPDWSRQGLVAFSGSDFSGSRVIYATDGSGEILMMISTPNGSQPTWSPDGRYLAFTGTRDGHGDIFAISADGSGLVQLTEGPAREGNPAWGPGN